MGNPGIDGFYKVAFDKTRGGLRLVEPFITAFCSHHKDSKYVQENGLLRQRQSYSSSIGFAIVFDTKRLSNLLERKSKEYRYMAGYFSDVVYDGDGESFTNNFADFIAQLEAFVVKLVRGDEPDSEALFLPFVLGTSKFKHQGFEEEREVRIVASPETRNVADTLDAMVAPDQASCERRIKKVRISESGAPYIELFESPREERLPIVRIIIGPHERQDELEARVRKMVRRLEIEVHCPRTPYVAAKGNTRHPNG